MTGPGISACFGHFPFQEGLAELLTARGRSHGQGWTCLGEGGLGRGCSRAGGAQGDGGGGKPKLFSRKKELCLVVLAFPPAQEKIPCSLQHPLVQLSSSGCPTAAATSTHLQHPRHCRGWP